MAVKKPAPKPKKPVPVARKSVTHKVVAKAAGKHAAATAPARKHVVAPLKSDKARAEKALAEKRAHSAANRAPSNKAPSNKVVPIKPAAAKPAEARPAEKPLAKPVAKPVGKSVMAVATMKTPRLPVPADDGDGAESSLLAGPRNVKPYVAKRGERYMSHEQLHHFQTILQSWKRDLMVEVDRTVSHMKDEAANFPDPNDRATQEEEFSLELRTRDRERKLIRKIDEALMRVDGGSYGYCLETGEEIGIKRLEARPVATLTIEAQERRERRERQYGERDDRYR
jgi:DnaK suppressor protein